MKKDIKFGTGGFRGIIDNDFTLFNVSFIAEALSQIILEDRAKKEIPLCYDRRFLSPEAAMAMALVFASHDIKVHMPFTEVPSPCASFWTQEFDADYGVMITASHNPSDWNGVKIFTKGGFDADEKTTDRIQKIIGEIDTFSVISEEEARDKGILVFFDAVTKYVDNIFRFSKPKLIHPLKVAYDNLNGVGIVSIGEAAERIGMEEFKVLNWEKDPTFRGKLPNPLPQNLEEVRSFVLENHYDMGFGVDSDGDRLGVIDEKGDYVSANEILACLYYYLIKIKGFKGDVVRNFVTSLLLDRIAEGLGFRCHEVDVGFKYITRKMGECDAIIGGESSGGLTIRDYLRGKDATFSVVLFWNMMDDMHLPVSEIVKQVKAFAHYENVDVETFVTYPRDKAGNIVSYLNENNPSFPRPIVKRDILGRNYRYWFNDEEWATLRLSNTENVLRVFLELKPHEDVATYRSCLRDFVAKMI